jgi:3-hydroxy-9,10-secoandrosta-1,3,5(10)-triene-9,17-dione monooxygenase
MNAEDQFELPRVTPLSTVDPMKGAAELRPLLATNAARAERERKLPEENVRALEALNLFKIFVPKRWGGWGKPLATALEVFAELAKGCASTAWVEMIISIATWSATMLPDRGQEEIFKSSPHTRVAGVFTPSSTARRVDGGYVCSGRWSFASGCDFASWATLGIPLATENGKPEIGLTYVPMSEVRIEDTWFVSGMKGTGSNTLVADNVFVPDHRILRTSRLVEGDCPGRTQTDEPSDHYSFVPVAALVLAGPILGMAEAVLELVAANTHKRGITYTSYALQADSSVVHRDIAEASLKIDSARLMAMDAAARIHQYGVSRKPMEYLSRAHIRGQCGYITQTVREAVDQLMSIAGASAFADSNPLQRYWRDINLATRHAVVASETSFELFGRAMLGLKGNITDLI